MVIKANSPLRSNNKMFDSNSSLTLLEEHSHFMDSKMKYKNLSKEGRGGGKE